MRVLWREEDMRGKVEEVPEEDWTIVYPVLLVAVCIVGAVVMKIVL